ncbi:hypothetical protein DRO54_05265 [Candidatus Bathyarchaeota archaeon]|nr:MAG: hypothetical protein DRO54_05265 [Candidatus Bathyarchaeota archaeon]
MTNTGLLSLGMFIVIVAVSLVMYSAGIILWQEILPLIIGLYGCWIIVLAGIKHKNPSKYERGAISTFAWGLLLAVAGFSSILSIRGLMSLLYVVAAVLLVIGILTIAVAIERKS